MSPDVITGMRALPLHKVIMYWDALEKEARKNGESNQMVRALCKADLFYLLVRVCGRKDMLHPWVYQRVREVEREPDGYLELWSRGHFKSSIVTFGKTVQDILIDPNTTFGIFSHTRPIAKAFLRQIMRELESNETLHVCFPDILWGKNTKESPKWSEDDGIIVKRSSNPPEATVEAWGLVDGQPTSKHFKKLLYDDVVVEGSVSNPEMIEKTNKGMEQSLNLVSHDYKIRGCGTRWHFSDSYRMAVDRGIFKPRTYPCSEDGTETGTPVFWSPELMAEKRRIMGPYTFAAQCLLNPKADALQGFKREWVKHYKTSGFERMTKYILVDAASSKKKGSDYTSMMVVGLGVDENYYVLDMIRDRLALHERADRLFKLHRTYKPIQVRYERYGMMADIEHIKDRQEREKYNFNILEVAGKSGKSDRIKRLLPLFEQGRIFFPLSLHVSNYEKNVRDLVHDFIEEEYLAFPHGGHDDMLDCLARIAEPDLPLIWPKTSEVPVSNVYMLGRVNHWPKRATA